MGDQGKFQFWQLHAAGQGPRQYTDLARIQLPAAGPIPECAAQSGRLATPLRPYRYRPAPPPGIPGAKSCPNPPPKALNPRSRATGRPRSNSQARSAGPPVKSGQNFLKLRRGTLHRCQYLGEFHGKSIASFKQNAFLQKLRYVLIMLPHGSFGRLFHGNHFAENKSCLR